MRKIVASRCIFGNAERVFAATAALHQILAGIYTALFYGVGIISVVEFIDMIKFTTLEHGAEIL